MAWPKGLSRKNRLPLALGGKTPGEVDSSVAVKLEEVSGLAIDRPMGDRKLFSHKVPVMSIKRSFDTSKWYKYTGERGIILDDSGRVCKWSVIKFEVVKTAYGIVAVRFEDGSFEAITGASLEDFEEVGSPKY